MERIADEIEALEKKMEDVKQKKHEAERRMATMDYQIAAQEADDYRHAHDRGLASLQLLKHKSSQEAARKSIQRASSDDACPDRDRQESDGAAAIEKKSTGTIPADWVPSIGDSVFVPDIGKEATLIKFTSKNKAVIRSGFLTITVERTTLQPL